MYNQIQYLITSSINFQTYNVDQLYSAEKTLLTITNIYPRRRRNIFTQIAGIFVFLLEYAQLFLMTMFVFTHLDNVTKATEALLYLFTQIAFLSKLTNFVFQHKHIRNMDKIVNDSLITDTNEEELKTITSFEINARFLANSFRITCLIAVIFYGVFPFYDATSEEQYPLDMWLPFNTRPYYTVIFISQMTSIGLGAWLNSTFDILCVKHISIITAQFEILKLKLVQITEARINNIPIETEVVKRLDRCLHLYDLLLRYKRLDNFT